VYRTSARAIYLAIPYECYTLVILPFGFIRTVPIACPISQLRRVPTSARAIYLAHHTQAIPSRVYTLVIPFCSLGFYLNLESRSANRLPDFSAGPAYRIQPVHLNWIACIASRLLPAAHPTIPGFGIAQCYSPARFLSCAVYRNLVVQSTASPLFYRHT